MSEKRAVRLEDHYLAGPFVKHWTVYVGEDSVYEVTRGSGCPSSANSSASSGKTGSQMYINEARDGRPTRRSWARSGNAITLVGSTYKTDSEIAQFNREWLGNNRNYELLEVNCQTYAQELCQFLVGGAFQMPNFPQAGTDAWASGPGATATGTGPIRSARATTGKAGAQWAVLGVEAEGPCAAASASSDIKNGNFGAFSEASIGRAEVKGPLGVRARVEPNLDTGVGIQGGQLKAKVLGFGFSLGGGGIGISTPLGGLGFGNSGK